MDNFSGDCIGRCRRIWHWVKSRAPKEATQAGPVSLPVVKCTIQDVTDFYEATGTTEAIDSVEIRARVEGYLEGIHFTDGQIVEEGQMLFTIEPEVMRPFVMRRLPS
jgi:multidrug efflux pump subunit AcrA (membrane-fusion protein)